MQAAAAGGAPPSATPRPYIELHMLRRQPDEYAL